MKHYRQVFLAILLLLLLCLPALRAQSLFLLEDNLEELAEETGTADWEDELEELSYRLQEPLNLNTATREQLEQFPFLTARQVEEIQAYIYIHGQMQTIWADANHLRIATGGGDGQAHHRPPAPFRLREACGGRPWLSFAKGHPKVRKARGFGSL